jgi:predicted lipid-binding transport protein (Tim44 family)
MTCRRLMVAFAAIATVLVLFAADANARAGGGFSGGSRGMRTFSAPPATRTAPTAASPIQRSMTQPGGAGAIGQASRPGLFGGLAAGFLGAGLFGLLFGHGFFGGMGGFASLLGLVLQIGLVIIVARLLFAWWQRRHEPALAAAHPATGHAYSGLGGMFGANTPAGEPLTIDKSDYDAFERLLGDVQAAYSAEDLNALRVKVTPEMLSYFSEQLSENASRGVINKIDGVKLEQGDLAEAWREGGVDYATVAMRFSLVDQTVERASGRTVEGGAPSEVTELWTFMRAHGGNWLLSAIQQS